MILFLKKYINKFRYAFSGVAQGLLHDRSIALQLGIGVAVILLCLMFPLTSMEWCLILFAIGVVIALEFINSAIEEIIDDISPEYSKMAKIAKDYAAAAVLVMSVMAAIIGCIIIGGHIL